MEILKFFCLINELNPMGELVSDFIFFIFRFQFCKTSEDSTVKILYYFKKQISNNFCENGGSACQQS